MLANRKNGNKGIELMKKGDAVAFNGGVKITGSVKQV